MRDLIVLAIVFGSLPLIFIRPYVGVLVWSWLSYMNPHRFAWGFAYNFPFAQVVAIATFIGLLFSGEKKKFPISSVTILLSVFILWMCITTLLAIEPSSSVVEWERMIKIQLIVFLTLWIMGTRERIDQLVWVIVISIGFFGVKGGIFAIATGGSYRVWGPPGSFIEGNNELALALIMVIPLMYYLYQNLSNKLLRYFMLFSIVMSFAAVVASYSRGAIIAVAAISVFFVAKSRHRISLSLLLIMLVVVGLFFLPEQWFDRMSSISGALGEEKSDSSFNGRLNAWSFAYRIAVEYPFGGGFNVFKPYLFEKFAPDPLDFHDAHSIYFEVLGEHGFVGLSIFLCMYAATYFQASWVIRKTKHLPQLKWAHDLTAMTQVGLIGYLVGGAALGLAYFDLPYHLLCLIVLTRQHVIGELANLDTKPTSKAQDDLPEKPLKQSDRRREFVVSKR